jgi:hypothetical protein
MLTQRVHLSSDAMLQEIGGEGVILDLASARYFGLDRVGLRTWQLLQADASLAAAASVLLAEYDVDPAALERDLITLVEQLVAAGLATVEAGDAPSST